MSLFLTMSVFGFIILVFMNVVDNPDRSRAIGNQESLEDIASISVMSITGRLSVVALMAATIIYAREPGIHPINLTIKEQGEMYNPGDGILIPVPNGQIFASAEGKRIALKRLEELWSQEEHEMGKRLREQRHSN